MLVLVRGNNWHSTVLQHQFVAAELYLLAYLYMMLFKPY
jgi:hypothetical protein